YKKDNDCIVTVLLSKEDIKTVNDISNGDNRYFFNLLLNYGNKETAEKGNLFYTIAENDYNNNLPLFESFTDEIKNILVKFAESGEIALPKEEIKEEKAEKKSDITNDSEKTEPKKEENSIPDKKVSPDDIKLGDVFLYRGEKVTVSSMFGIYPDDIGISKKEKTSNGIEYEVTENVDKYQLASVGKYLGNIDEPQIEEVKEDKSEEIAEETAKKQPTAEELKVCDVVKLPPVVLTDRNGKLNEFPSEYGVVTENDGKMVSFRTFSDETLTEANGITSNSVSSLNEDGFEYIKQISEIPSLFANKDDISIEEQEYNADIKEKVSQQDEDLLTNLQKEFDYNTSMFLIAAYDNSQMNGWKGDTVKENSIKRAFYEVLDSTPLAEKAFEIFKNTIPDSVVNYINTEQSSEITAESFEKEKAKTFFVNGGGILTIPLKTNDKLFERLAEAGLKTDKNSTYQILFETDNGSWNKIIIPDRWGNKTNNIDIDSVMTRSEIEIAKEIAESIMPVGKKDKAENFRITDNKLGEWTPKNKYKFNVEAIKTLKQIEKEDRQATPEEQEILSKYVGWGGLPEVFDERKENWSKEFTELKELLTDDEYVAARSSTLNAHYTTPLVINSIYKALDNMEFKGGKVLEPAVGVGNFFGMLPEKLKNDTKLYGVELDSITGRIAKQLYPNANIQVKGFEKTTFKNDFFDVAVGNVPFGNYRVHDENFKSNDLIHDYFIKKSLEKVKPNGVIAFVTSKGTMDKQDNSVRKYLAERADLLGAIRLPQTAFQKNAGTEVTTDILFLQKREDVRDFSIDEMPDWVNISEDNNGIAVNNYFIENPDMILGEMQLVSGQFGMESACVP
ncbi:MAG: class I SAM-dependent methyltransferase, partial [Firmicutes bacterium]|nr:class I SAM-dependent methyltransferase [Bacillota bacterium]